MIPVRYYAFALCIAFAIAGCNLTGDSGRGLVPTNRIYNSQSLLISPADTFIVYQLFRKNNLSLSHLQVFRYSKDGYGYHVRCNQFFNGLKLFTGDVVFAFDNQQRCTYLGGDTLTAVSVGTMPALSHSVAGELFRQCLENDPMKTSPTNGFDYTSFNAELGYYDLNSGGGLPTKQIVLAWKLTIADHNVEYPVAYVRADSPTVIYYFNGIIID